ncbi:hypothetical protein DQ04_14201010 [Trypanosoma grayi]|uniref:hypothetical protein n=1 Tax=Trypanosoma grayi TaxID=71804 RepID=UPI0004F4653C|nr:hypothetical protein DQ04_14201010 [Trypanosoma grayi]KEG06386.1 hypothetical protein DQ04_14201010 [Trypanosoma grayi]
MTSHVQSQLFGRVPRQRPNQHHLPPLLHQPTSSSSSNVVEVFSHRGARSLPAGTPSRLSDKSSCFSLGSRNCCSVSTVVPGADTDVCGASSCCGNNGVSYAVEHGLPNLLNDMVDDMLRDRPEADIDAWMTEWFEQAYERRQREVQQQSTKSGTHHLGQCVISNPSSISSCGSDAIVARRSPMVMSVIKPATTASPAPVMLPRSGENVKGDAPKTQLCSSVDSPHYIVVAYSPLQVASLLPQGMPPPLPLPLDFASTAGGTLTMGMIAQRSLPPPPEPRLQSAGDDKQIVARLPRGGDFRLKSRSPLLIDVGSSEGLAPSSA